MSNTTRGRQPRPKGEKYESPDPQAQAGTQHKTGKKKQEKQEDPELKKRSS